MTSRARKITRWASVALLTSALAACGSTGSKSADTTAAKGTTTTTAATTSTAASSATTDSAATTSPVRPKTTVVTTPSTAVATRGGVFCKSIADSYNAGLSQSSVGASPAALRKVVEASQEKNKQTLASAPGEIKEDVTTLFGASDRLITALDKVDYDYSKLPPKALTELSSPAVQSASVSVEAFVKNDCGIDLTSSSSASGPATTTP